MISIIIIIITDITIMKVVLVLRRKGRRESVKEGMKEGQMPVL